MNTTGSQGQVVFLRCTKQKLPYEYLHPRMFKNVNTLEQELKNALRGVGLRAWLSDPSLFSGPHPVTANSLDLFHPADQGCLHSHVTEVVSAVTESMEIVPKALCGSV